ncbi:MAG: metal ABC transporter solute-binding protein, Zn/Mn family [Rhodoglobus sp.]
MIKIAIPVLALTTLSLVGCTAAPAEESSELVIVASTSVYGDIAEKIVGDLGTVTSIISDSTADPHSVEVSARDQLAFADADLVIANGGGYDPFVAELVEASDSQAVVVDAVEVAALTAGDGAANEHVWYSLEGMTRVVEAITEELSTIDTANAAAFSANSATLVSQIEELETRTTEMAAQLGGGSVMVTEPVPVYLLDAVGFEDITPGDFIEAIEEDSDVPPLALDETLALVSGGSVRLLAYNPQTASPETERVRQAAESAGVPVVEFTEILPEDSDYVSWMTENLSAMTSALQP